MIRSKIQNTAYYTMIASLTASILFAISWSALPFFIGIHITAMAFIVWFILGTHKP